MGVIAASASSSVIREQHLRPVASLLALLQVGIELSGDVGMLSLQLAHGGSCLQVVAKQTACTALERAVRQHTLLIVDAEMAQAFHMPVVEFLEWMDA